MNRLKKKILEIVRTEGRLSAEEIAERLNEDSQEVEKILKELHNDKVIVGYQAIVNAEKSGDNSVLSLIEVQVTPQRDLGFDMIAKRIYKFPEVKTCYLVSGAYDLMLVVEGKSLHEVARFVAEKLSTLDHVQTTRTHFLLKKYKEAGVIFEQDEELQRLVISP